MKLHIGCGSVYLRGWINIDMRGPKTFLASSRSDLVERLGTTDDAYYARHSDKTMDRLRAGPLDQEYVCDEYGSFENIPAAYWSVDEVLARQSFEHLSIAEAHKALDQIDGILKPNGILRLDVPDSAETMDEYRRTGDSFYKRHFLGPRRDDNGYHLPYTRERLRTLVEEHGFVFQAEEPNIHFFPAFTLRFVKPGARAPRDYIVLPAIPDDWQVVDVGPGGYPLPRANVYLDNNYANLDPLQTRGASTIMGDLMNGLPNVPDKAFDYVWCSHVLEHVADPLLAAATLSRIGKRGCMVVPSAMKEALFAYEELDHKWLALPVPCGCDQAIFVRYNETWIAKLRDVEIQKISSRLWRTGPNRLEEARYLRKWFYQNESSLDVVVHWENELIIQVIG